MWALSRRKWKSWVTWDMEKTELFNDFLPQCSLGSAPATLPKLQKAKAETEKMKNQLL